MPSAREREAPRAIQHQFPTGGHSAAQSFHKEQTRSPSDHRRPAHTTVVLVMTALFVLMLAGPNILTEKEIFVLTTPAPRHSQAAPGWLAALTDQDDPWTATHALPWPDEFTHGHNLCLPATPETMPGTGFAGSPPPLRHTSTAA